MPWQRFGIKGAIHAGYNQRICLFIRIKCWLIYIYVCTELLACMYQIPSILSSQLFSKREWRMTRNWAPRFISHLMRKYLESVINWTTRELDPNASCCCWPMQNFPFFKIFFSYYSYSFTYHTYTRSKNWSHILFSIGLASFFAPCLKYKIPTTKQKRIQLMYQCISGCTYWILM